MKKTQWFIKPIGALTNETIMDWLAKTNSHQDGIAAQQITVKGKKESLIAVPDYQIIKAIIESQKNSIPLKFEIFFIPTNSACPRLWNLYKHLKKIVLIDD